MASTGVVRFYILLYMKPFLIEVDADIAAQLEKVAPSRSRRRSEFVRNAIRRALWDLAERATEEAYLRHPDSSEEGFDPAVWEPGTPARRSRRKPR